MKTVDYKSLNQSQKQLLSVAKRALETAYNPYFEFFVGAALLSKTGEIIDGSNVENAAYGSTICAERTALVRANAMGHRKFYSIAIIGRVKNSGTKDITAPCGACRQMLFEASQISECDLEVILSTTDNAKIIITSITELLPLGFGPRDVGVDINKYKK